MSSPIAAEEQPAAARSGGASIRALVDGHRILVVSLATTSLLGGLAEALFLVLVTRAAFAISSHQHRFDAIAGHHLSIRVGLVIAFVLVVVRVALALLASSQTARLTADIVADTRRKLATAFLEATWETQQGDRTGQLQELLTTFTVQCTGLVSGVTQAITSGFNLLALLGLAVALDPAGAVVVIISVTLLASLLRPVRSAVKRRGKRSADVGMQFATSLSEISQLGLEVHVFHVQQQTKRRVIDLIDRTADATRRLVFASSLVPSLYTGLAYLALVGALAAVSIAGGTNLVSLGAVMLVMLRSLSYGQALQSAAAAVASTLPYLQTLEERLAHYQSGRQHDGGQPIGHVGQLDVDQVSFSYEAGDPVLHDLKFSIREREVVGIVGPSGGGKSTLVQLLLGLRDPDVGSLLADGRPTRDLARREWARKVTFVPQRTNFISGTISDNIRFLRDDVTQADIEKAARLAHLADDVEGFPERYERQVGDQGGFLSGGQQQRLCIARALVEDPDVLILDEPTSALDMRSEHLIRQTLLELKEHMTIVIIAHRLSTLDICERIMVIQDGRIKGFDTPSRLAETNDFYHEALVLSGLR